MKFLKEKKGIIAAFLIGAILASSIAVYATVSASQVDYKDGKTVEYALNDLYSKNIQNKASLSKSNIGSFNFSSSGNGSKTLDIKEITNSYRELTVDNFAYSCSFYSSIARPTYADDTFLLNLAYNNETGILTITYTGRAIENEYYLGFKNVNIYLYNISYDN